MASTDSTRPSMRSVMDCGPVSILPPGVVRFCVASARCTSMGLSPYARRATGLSQTWIWRARPPMIWTCPTPDMLSICRRTLLSAISVTSRMGRFDLSATSKTGEACGSTLETIGGSIPLGSSRSTLLTLSRTSCAAVSTFFSSLNAIAT